MCNPRRRLSPHWTTLGFLVTVSVSGFSFSGDAVDEAAAEKARAYNRYYREVKKNPPKDAESQSKTIDRIMGPSIMDYGKAMDRAHVEALQKVQKNLKNDDGSPIPIKRATKKQETTQPKPGGKSKTKGFTNKSGNTKSNSRASENDEPAPNPVVEGTQKVDEIIYEGKKKKKNP